MLKNNIVNKITNTASGFKLSTNKTTFKISELARKSGVNEETLSQILKGETNNPGIYTVAKIADALRCSVTDLIGDDISQSYKREVKLDLAKSCVVTVIDLLRQHEQEINLDQFIYILMEVYMYCLDKNLKTVDMKFATCFITDVTKSKT